MEGFWTGGYTKTIESTSEKMMRPRGAIKSVKVNNWKEAATGFLHLNIVKSGQLPFLGRNTMFWPFFLHLGGKTVEIGRCTCSYSKVL